MDSVKVSVMDRVGVMEQELMQSSEDAKMRGATVRASMVRGWQRGLWSRLPAVLLLVSLLVILLGSMVSAQADLPAVVAPPQDVTADEVNIVARELWCPLCSGVRLDACELKACVQMKEMIALKLAEGEDVDSIKQYFVTQYGPQVLGEPPREGFNWLAWILPVVALLVGGGFFWHRTHGLVRPNDTTTAQATRHSGPGQGATPVTDEDYERKLDEELAKYG